MGEVSSINEEWVEERRDRENGMGWHGRERETWGKVERREKIR